MEKKLHIEFLELLNKEGIGVNIDIIPFLNKNFSKIKEGDFYGEKGRTPILFLDELLSTGLISFDGEEHELFFNVYKQRKTVGPQFLELAFTAYI